MPDKLVYRPRGRTSKITPTNVLKILSQSGRSGLSFTELYERLQGGSRNTLWNILKMLAKEGVIKRDFETRRYVAIYPYSGGNVITIPIKLSLERLKCLDIIAKKQAISRSDLIEESLDRYFQTLLGESDVGVSDEELRKLTELGIAGYLAKLLTRLDRRLGALEKHVGLLK